MPAQSTMLSPQQLIEAAKVPEIAYNDKNWNAVRASVTPDVIYDEIATGRRLQGVDQAIAAWQGWAKAFPDSKATFDNAIATGNTVVLEVTWRGTHTGPLETPTGTIAATGKRIEIRACVFVELTGEKTRLQRHYFDMASLLKQIGVAG
ncbi:MAG: ester cyclase [Gemmatimonadales bacterium]